VEVIGVLSKVAEAAGLAGLLGAVVIGSASRTIRMPTWKMAGLPLLLAVAGAGLLYGAGVGAERLFPSLAEEKTSVAVQPATTASDKGLRVSALSERLTRKMVDVKYDGIDDITIEATYATPAYFKSALTLDSMIKFLPEQNIVFVYTERIHTDDLPEQLMNVTMAYDGDTYKPDLIESMVTSPHHRITLMRFPVEQPTGLGHHFMELKLPGNGSLEWHMPISYAGIPQASGFELSWVSVLAILGGLVAAMWPCLFQLTAFFIPTLAGVSMSEAKGNVTVGKRLQVVKAAFFFVLGFTIVYTVAGAAIGFLADKAGDTQIFYTWQRYAAVVGGVAILVLALRTAAKVRAPLVCKMPVLRKMAHGERKASSPLELMFAGLAFATGCMTCFGAAIVIAMVMYVGISGSAAVGALTLFLFSIGMGVPLVAAATAMAKILPTLSRMKKYVPWMGLISAVLMAGFAVLLITGNYMIVTEWIYRGLPIGF